MDISKLTYAELLKLRAEIDRVIDGRREQERAETLEKIQRLAQSAGFEIDDLLGGRKPNRKSPSGVRTAKQPKVQKYANPTDPSQTWSGRGNAPGWAREYFANGGKRDDLLISK